ncbi:MAG: tRNA uridine-5-carboxymethylaminomethyl(34) synthesis enzyme MnmG [Dethiobacteria bacterium]|jgi:tRNA uridine 5-carboxymethylaminomethyl modification enzyme
MELEQNYDVIVIGAGHAGCEAALAAARMGCRTLLISTNIDHPALMACNPSLGGPGKGHLIKEIDALGGIMGRNGDEHALQMRRLNTSKGPAVQALRAQIDKNAYQRGMRSYLDGQPLLFLREAAVRGFLVEDGVIKGVTTRQGSTYLSQAVVLATGVFLRSEIFVGEDHYPGAPGNQLPSTELSENIVSLGFQVERFRTGTPPRVYRSSINFENLQLVEGEPGAGTFSYVTETEIQEQVPCHLTYTTAQTHRLIIDHIQYAPSYSGLMKGSGPRYCPSIEDKVVRFPDRKRHPVFIEPEGRDSVEMYLQGISTGLPEELQRAFLRTIPGLEEVIITRPAYEIEYDFCLPTQLKASLETKLVKGLFFAGQVNGTTGYEEAAAQGLMAGINAALFCRGEPAFILTRTDAYIGVLIDDLVTKGVSEPYRMFTSRCEYRLLLRHENADLRLTEKGFQLGLISKERHDLFEEKKRTLAAEKKKLSTLRLFPSERINGALLALGSTKLTKPQTLAELLKRPEITYNSLRKLDEKQEFSLTDKEGIASEVETQIKYEGYIAKQEANVKQTAKLEEKVIPADFCYNDLNNLSTEAKQKLNAIRPRTLGQASRIDGVSPADLSYLAMCLERKSRSRKTN